MVGFCAQGWEGFHAQGLVGSCFLALVLGLGSSQGQDVLSLAFPPLHPLLRAPPQLASKNDAATGSFCTRLFSPISSFSIYLPCLYLPCFYISLVFISPPLIVILSRIIILPLTRASHSYILSVPIHAQQATPPRQSRGFS